VGARKSVVGAELQVRHGCHLAAMIGAWLFDALSVALPGAAVACAAGTKLGRQGRRC
jgi:hypothetical protein